jgi:sugar lactone lactonase YvrE
VRILGILSTRKDTAAERGLKMGRGMNLAGTLLCTFSLVACSAGDPGGTPTADTESTESGALRGSTKPDTVLVTLGDGTIHRLSASGADLGVFGPSDLSEPMGLASSARGDVYVADTINKTIRKFAADGRDLGVFVGSGLDEPTDLVFDRAGDLLVSDAWDSTIRRFSASGHPLGTVVSLLGFGCPTGLAVDGSGRLFVADICASVVREFSSSGGGLGVLSAPLSNPIALAFDEAGDLFVANSDNGGELRNTIREFSPTAVDLGTFASDGLHFPSSLAFLGTGTLLVANEDQRPGTLDYSLHAFAPDGSDLGDFAVLPAQPRSLLVLGGKPKACRH